ncbi:MAG TPA: response regulator, partial [bacterium]|nr:response regulator [bacterium]
MSTPAICMAMKNQITVTLLDDNFTIRQVIKTAISKLAEREGVNIRLYTSSNGVEGLGYVLAAKSELIIIDSTLPKYSGKELIHFIHTNPRFKNTSIIVLHEGDIPLGLEANYVTLDKRLPRFLNLLTREVRSVIATSYKSRKKERIQDKILNFMSGKAITTANLGDIALRQSQDGSLFKKVISYPYWFLLQLVTSVLLVPSRLFASSSHEINPEQEKIDIKKLRVRTYPTIAAGLTTLILFFMQVTILVVGGVTLFNRRMESIFALGVGEKGYEFNNQNPSTKFKYDPELIEFTDSGVRLKQEIITSEEPTGESVVNNQLPITNDQDIQPKEEIVTEPGEEVEAPVDEVLGISDNDETESVLVYPTSKPSIVTKDGIRYTRLVEITEKATIVGETQITYQLSPDGTNWYYYSDAENRWAKTTQGGVSSNTIQEINGALDLYEQTLGSGKLYFKIFLYSSGSDTPVLSELVVEKETDLLTTVNNELPPEPTITETVVGKVDFNILEPVIFNAAYFNGEKVVKGKLLNKDKTKLTEYQIPAEDLEDYEVGVYFSNSKVASKNYLIFTTGLYLNQKGEVEFFLRAPSAPGGYVTAEVVQKDKLQITNDKETGPVPTAHSSSLATPVENATFTVDSTGDGADAGIDGSCDDGGGNCTLRAALEESNANAVADTIAFNIPTGDAGYRDYDDPDTASSGDSIGGDDYWTIRPATVLPSITDSGTDIDGATQTINQGDTNTSGPEVELHGSAAGEVDGLTFSSTATNGSINSLVVNRFGSTSIYAGVRLDADNFVLTDSYVGTDTSGIVTPAERQAYGIYIFESSNATIGNTTSDGNVISGNLRNGIHAACGTGGGGQTINIRGNMIGLGADGDTPIANQNGIVFGDDCVSEIGGNLATHRNLISSNSRNSVNLKLSASDVPSVGIYNNYIGTDITGTKDRGNLFRQMDLGKGIASYSGTGFQVRIGALNKGNLIRYGRTGCIRLYIGRDVEVSYNTISDCFESGIEFAGGDGNTYDISIHHNFFGESTSDPYFGLSVGTNSWWGIRVDTNKNIPDIHDNEIVHNLDDAPGTNNEGIYISNGENGSIYNNITRGGVGGLVLNSSSDIEVYDNEFHDGVNYVVLLRNVSGNNNVHNNLISGGDASGIKVGIDDNLALNNILRDNSIIGSAGLPINLYVADDPVDEITLNDPGDVDTGHNDLQNYPTIDTVEYLGSGKYRLNGKLDGSNAEAPFTIEICESDKHILGRGGCADSLGTAITASTPDSTSGASNYFNWTMDVTVSGSDGSDSRSFSTLATNVNGSTSEFGENFLADANNPNYIFGDYEFDLTSPINGIQITDRTPLLDWEGSGDPLIDHYDVYLNHSTSKNLSKIGSIGKGRTNFQISSELPLAYATWYWQVKGVQADGTVSGTSVIESFEVIEDIEGLETTTLNGEAVVEEMRPVFSWNKGGKEDIKYYEIYLREKVKEGDPGFNPGEEGDIISEENLLATIDDPDITSYTPDEDLEPGTYEWKVISYYADGEIGGESEIEEFTIVDPLAGLPETEAAKEEEPSVTETQSSGLGIGEVFKIFPLIAYLMFSIVVIGALFLSSVAFSLISGGVFHRIGLLLGAIIPRKKKYWGIVYDISKSEILPFAVVRLFKEKELITQTVTDVRGRYGMLVDGVGTHRMEVAADGFKSYNREINVTSIGEIIEDVGMERLGENLGAIKKFLNYSRGKAYKGFNYLLLLLMIIGFMYTLYVTIQSPVLFNFVLLGIYFILGIINAWQIIVWSVKNMGSIVDLDTKVGIEGVSVRFYDKERQLDVGITNKEGNLKMNLKEEEYEVRSTKAGYQDWVGPVKLKKGGYLQKNLGMKKAETGQQA